MSIIRDKKKPKKLLNLLLMRLFLHQQLRGETINGQIARFVGVEAIPFRLKQGDQSFYF